MKSISIRGVDDELALLLSEKSKTARKSVNQLVLEILRKEVGLNKKKQFTREYTDLDALFGKWSEKEFQSIQSKIDSERHIDSEIWNEPNSD